jgi:hypothetical protein
MSAPLKRRQLLVDQGGLMRCCIQSIADWITAKPEAEVVEGETLSCRFESKEPTQMVVTGDTVRWADPVYPPIPKSKP